jgi:hypothetical protein
MVSQCLGDDSMLISRSWGSLVQKILILLWILTSKKFHITWPKILIESFTTALTFPPRCPAGAFFTLDSDSDSDSDGFITTNWGALWSTNHNKCPGTRVLVSSAGSSTLSSSHTLWRSDLRGWRALSSGVLTVAPCACCVNLYICMYNVNTSSLSVFLSLYHFVSIFLSFLFLLSNKIQFFFQRAVHCAHSNKLTFIN